VGTYTDTMEGCPIEGGDGGAWGFPPSAYCYIPLQPPLWPLSTSQRHLLEKIILIVIVITAQHSGKNTMTGQMEGNIRKYVVGGSVTAGGGVTTSVASV
jgi:hypothetical protein